MRIALLAIAVLSVGCGGHNPFDKPEARIHIQVSASNTTPTTDDLVTLSTVLTTRNNPDFISFVWVCTVGPTAPSFSNSSTTQTNITFNAPGNYTVALRVYYYDENNDRRTAESSVDLIVSPAPPTAPG